MKHKKFIAMTTIEKPALLPVSFQFEKVETGVCVEFITVVSSFVLWTVSESLGLGHGHNTLIELN